MSLEMSVSKIFKLSAMIFQNYQNVIEIISNVISIVAFGGDLKCPREIDFNPPGLKYLTTALVVGGHIACLPFFATVKVSPLSTGTFFFEQPINL